MFTDIADVNQCILYFLNSKDLLSLLDVDNKTRKTVIDKFPVDNLFKESEQYCDDINLTVRLLGETELIKNIITFMYKSSHLDRLLTETFLNNNLRFMEMFLSATPEHFNWGDLDGLYLGYHYKLNDKNEKRNNRKFREYYCCFN